MKRTFFPSSGRVDAGCTAQTLTGPMEKKLDGKYTRMLRAIVNKSWRQHPTKQQLYGHLSPTIQVRRTRHARHCWRSRDELISDVLLWTHSRGRASVGRPTRAYLQHLCTDTECSLEDLPEVMEDRDESMMIIYSTRSLPYISGSSRCNATGQNERNCCTT